MPLLTRKDFAILCGESPEKLNTYIYRGKCVVLATNHKQMDTEDPLNARFITERQVKNLLIPPPNKQKIVKETADNPVKFLKNEAKNHQKTDKNNRAEAIQPKEIQQRIAEQQARSQKTADQENLKVEKDLQLKELNIQQKQLDLNRKAGELIPVDLVKDIIRRHADGFLKNFEKGSEKVAEIFINIMAGGDPKMRVRVMEEMKRVLEQCIKDAGEDSMAEIELLVSKYAAKLMRGERSI